MAVLTGLEATAKSVEEWPNRSALTSPGTSSSRSIAPCNWICRSSSVNPIPILYVQMDGTGVLVVKNETEGRKDKVDGLPAHTREVKLGCVFTQTGWDKEG